MQFGIVKVVLRFAAQTLNGPHKVYFHSVPHNVINKSIGLGVHSANVDGQYCHSRMGKKWSSKKLIHSFAGRVFSEGAIFIFSLQFVPSSMHLNVLT